MSSTIIVSASGPIEGLVASAIGTDITAVVVGPREAAAQAAEAGVDRVVWLGDPGTDAPEAWAQPVADLVARRHPDLVLASTHPTDRVLAGAVAARLRAPVFTMVHTIAASDGTVELTHSAFGGITEETVTVTGPTVVVLDAATSPDGQTATAGTAAVEETPVTPTTPIEIIEQRAATHSQAQLGRARRIVSVGRGLKTQADLTLVEDLAKALDADLACSRPLAEGVGWFSHDRYVGVTGQHVRPDLYLAVGISGQLQHVVGARDAGTIVVINTDAKCPYFAEADYCVVGDLYQVVPVLTEALR